MDLTRIVPHPTPIRFAGRSWLASEYRVSDLAELQEAANAWAPSPFEDAVFDLARMPRDREWKVLLACVLDAQEGFPPDMDDFLETDEGVAKQIHLALRRHQTGFTEDAARDLLADSLRFPRTFEVEFGRLMRLAWGSDPLGIIRDMIDGPARVDAREPTDWAKVYYRYISSCRNGPAFGDLTLSQLRAWSTRGETVDEGREDFADVAERRREFWRDLER